MHSICVFCGSQTGRRSEYVEATRELARLLVGRDIKIIYGGGSVGLMGVLADEALTLGGQVEGVIPEHLCREELLHTGLSDLHVTPSLLERKCLMMELADGFIALPGGLGTIDEILEIHTWAQLGQHSKPIGLINTAGYFEPFIKTLQHAQGEGFLHADTVGMLCVAPEPAELLEQLSGRLNSGRS